MHLPMPQKTSFSILKRGIYGVYQHVSEEHLHRYLANSISATTTGPRSALMMMSAPNVRSVVS